MKVQTFLKHRWPFLLFLLAFIALSLIYNYHESTFYRPQSFHAWRQADCASITLNYYQDSLSFFNPQVHNLTSAGGTSGACATSEIPFLYYFVGKIYALFGPHEFIIRLINLIVWFFGLFYAMKLLYLLLKNYFWSISSAFAIFTAPVLVYYGNNYLTNVSALSFTMIAWYQIFRLHQEYSLKKIISALLLIFIAASFKISALLSFLSYFIILIFSAIQSSNVLLRRGRIFMIVGFFAVLILLSTWIFWVANYNSCNDCTYFSTRIFPLWDLSSDKISEVMDSVQKLWLADYFHWSMLSVFGFSALILIRYRKLLPQEARVFNLLLIGGSLLYILLQFFTFRDHDYYVIDLYIVWIAVVAQSLYIMKMQFSRFVNSMGLRIAWIAILAFNAYYAAGRQAYRYNQWPNAYATEYQSIYSCEPFLRQLGISHQDTIVFLPDPTNVSLYLMNQKGWTQYTDQRFNEGKPIRYNQDSDGLSRSISHGARYLIVKDMSVLTQFEWVRPHAQHLLGEYKNMLVFDLLNEEINFDLHKNHFSEIFSFRMEDIRENSYLSKDQQIHLPVTGTHDSIVSLSGHFSCKLDSKNPYGLTYEFVHQHKWNKQYQIEVARRGNREAGIVLALDGSNEFYQMTIEGEPIQNSEWVLIRWNVTIPSQFNGRNFKLYLYNPGEEEAWFDDFQLSSIEVGEVQ